MFRFPKSVFVMLLSDGRSLAAQNTWFRSLNNQSYLAGPTLINLDSSKLNYYSFAVSLEKCGWSCKNLINARFCDAMMLWYQTKKNQVWTYLICYQE